MNATPATSARRAASVAPPVRAARERILDTAFGLFYAHGIRGVGIDRIIAESGVAKATFYKYFPAKDDLVLAYLDKVDAVWSEQLHAAASAAGPDPAAQLVGMFDALDSACRREGYRGCAFINAAAENEAGTPIHTRTLRHKNQVRAWVRQLAVDANAADPDALARSLTLLLDGGLASGSVDAGADAPVVAKAAAQALVSAAVA
ncbi:MAG: TetR/AcrR family transcriptional regulator [Actinobacteria bacterium]|nr:TetR/AcrR family transcriptional regulator [Actinomycetota bacterium]MCB8998345.1 TetR/AcrR family transcriptional regulator [Actinomycetota bacterium]MCB9415470.1 TetR/AcrR family transcriptional regulator [Actinomycetota bacterium]HRY10492.1 TetR/AcrR family transcriptional regulator [Candidatus Nanopelagicales bacterium]